MYFISLRRATWLAAVCLLLASPAVGHAKVPAEAREGVKLYKDSSYTKAADAFRQATIAAPDDPRWRYGLGLSEAQSGDFESAAGNLEASANGAKPKVAADAYYNAGNVYLATKDYGKAIKSYREALLRHPEDADAKHNLELALRQLMQQQQQQQNQQQPDSSQQNQQDSTQNQQQKQNQSQNQQDSTQNQQQQPDSTQQQSDSLQNANAQPDSTMSREQAERILKALADEEAKLRDKAKHMHTLPAPGGKDW